jgi:RNA polymerase sigma factor (sigma-70 family)
LTEGRRKLAAKYVPLARSLSKRLAAVRPWLSDDFASAASGALVEAAGSYDPAQGVTFATFARHRIRGALREVLRYHPRTGWRRCRGAPKVLRLSSDLERLGRVLFGRDREGPGAVVESAEIFEHWLECLSARHAEVCRLYYIGQRTQAQIAHVLGCKQPRVARLHREALDTLGARLRDHGVSMQ